MTGKCPLLAHLIDKNQIQGLQIGKFLKDEHQPKEILKRIRNKMWRNLCGEEEYGDYYYNRESHKNTNKDNAKGLAGQLAKQAAIEHTTRILNQLNGSKGGGSW